MSYHYHYNPSVELPAPKCPKCEKGNLLLVKMESSSFETHFIWKCSNPKCDHQVGR